MNPDISAPPPERTARSPWRVRVTLRHVGIALALLLLLLVLLVATFPVGWAKGRIERDIAAQVGAPVSIGALTREPVFSFTPTIVARDLRIAQPAWAGAGHLVRVDELRLRLPIFPALMGRGLRPDGIEARGLVANLVRDAQGRSNWSGRRTGGGGSGDGKGLENLVVPDGRFTLRDARRHLALAGQLSADARGVSVIASGRFHDAPATFRLKGPAISGRDHATPWPFTFDIASPLLNLSAKGNTIGALNIRDMTLDLRARAPSLKYLDDIIRAGLFGSQPIDLTARVRHQGRDWFVDRLSGRIGRSSLVGKAEILKRDGRSKIDATLDFATFDFDDLADAQGLAEHLALKARIGDRVLPNTRINLAKVGPTDGQIRFTARRLLFKQPSVFRSLKGVIRLEGKLLTVDQVEAGLTNGRMTGRLTVDHRSGGLPLLNADLRLSDGRLGPLLDASDMVDAPFRARIQLGGRGDTVREALSRADGHVGFAAANGQIARVAAAVLAQDMGKAIGAALNGKGETVPLNCIIVGFEARQGRLTAAPFLIDTGTARSRGTGGINLDGERISLVIAGQARDSSGLPIVDPIRLGGTLSAPVLDVANVGGKTGTNAILGAVVKSIGGALGLAKKQGPAVEATGPIDCPALSRTVLRERR
jgi:uncharacterized protein involved in outer membrane biogenesis